MLRAATSSCVCARRGAGWNDSRWVLTTRYVTPSTVAVQRRRGERQVVQVAGEASPHRLAGGAQSGVVRFRHRDDVLDVGFLEALEAGPVVGAHQAAEPRGDLGLYALRVVVVVPVVGSAPALRCHHQAAPPLPAAGGAGRYLRRRRRGSAAPAVAVARVGLDVPLGAVAAAVVAPVGGRSPWMGQRRGRGQQQQQHAHRPRNDARVHPAPALARFSSQGS